METHSSILASRIPQTEEPGGLQSMGSQSQTQLKRLGIHAVLIMYLLGYAESIDNTYEMPQKMKIGVVNTFEFNLFL